jgi:hypothetical protein
MPTFDEIKDKIPPKEVLDKLDLLSTITGLSTSFLTNELKDIVCSPDCMIFPTIQDMQRAALEILISKYKHRMSKFRKYDMELYVIDKTGTKSFNVDRPVCKDHPTDLAKIKEREEKNTKRIADGKKPKDYKHIEIRKIPTGEIERVNVHVARVYGIFGKYGLFANEEIGDIFGDKFRTHISEFILEDDACQILQHLECGKSYKVKCNAWFVDNHHKMTLRYFPGEPILIDTKLPSTQEIICRLAKPIEIDQITQDDVGKFKVVHGFVKNGRTKVNKRNNMQGNMTLISIKDNISYFNVVWWNGPEFALKYIEGTEVIVVCDIQNTENYGINGIGHFIIPVRYIKKPKQKRKPKPISINRHLVEVSEWW